MFKIQWHRKNDTHAIFYEIFALIPVKLVTAFQGYCKWHLARKCSFRSISTHAMIKALLRHYQDLEFDFIQTICEFMCPNYDYSKRMRACALDLQWSEKAVNNINSSNSGNFIYTDAELLENGDPDPVKVLERPIL